MKSPALSVIIVNYRSWKRLSACLNSLLACCTNGFCPEVIVIDNDSGDGQLTAFRQRYPGFRFASNTGNLGFANGCNLGASMASCEFLLFLNPDTIVTADALTGLLELARANPEYTLLSCRQMNSSGKDDKPSGIFPSLRTLLPLQRALIRRIHGGRWPFDNGAEVIFPDWISGSVVLVRRTEFEAAGGWFDGFFMYYEDVDLCRRIRDSGGIVVLANAISIVHDHGGASRINHKVKALTKTEVIISRHLYVHRHFQGRQRTLAQTWLVLDSLILGRLFAAIAGLLLFFLPSVAVYRRVYLNLLWYYAGALRYSSWLSPRSVRHPRRIRTPR